MKGSKQNRRFGAGVNRDKRLSSERGAGLGGAAGHGASLSAAGTAALIGGRPRAALKAKPAGKPSAAAEREPVYSTRYYLWSLLISGWLFTVYAALTRGHMPEIFIAVILTGMLLQGLLPLVAARMSRLQMSRELSSVEGSAGGELKVKLDVRSRLPLPLLWVSVQETLMNDSGARVRTVQFRHITLPWTSSSWQIQYTIRGLERGEYHFLPVEAVFGDMFGLTAIRRCIARADNQGTTVNGASASLAQSFLVMPAWHGAIEAPRYGGSKASVQDRGYEREGLSTHIGRMARSQRQRTTADRSGTQCIPYRLGDNARRIDWRTVARGGAWLTKREWTTRPAELLIAMDTMYASYNGDDRLFDCAAGYTAELVRHAATERIPFRLLGEVQPYTGRQSGTSRTRRSYEREALERLARLRPQMAVAVGESAPWTSVNGSLPRGATIIVVTAEWRNGELGEQLAALASVNGCRPEVHVLTPNKVPSIGMRERKRDWESAGIRVVWAVIADEEALSGQGAEAEGGDANEGAGQ
ncbi:DUF58 domain-containing protein [Paenibacillus xylaniclasticus]|uniref:DUF58 domain-containing protein n=1 Tax=Paenibacillus xylaniclasticus TaxID=588083 RepID=UPI000FD9989E|nr:MULTISPECIES: DUF58 domain-containing protein [Paenibacillus]GFN33303.1 hypothetical protein PCURB6_35630 [Paenibacillus curdlanolyticus]